MSTREDITPIFEKCLDLIDEREVVYGDAWKQNGEEVCAAEVMRKGNYLKAQWERGQADSPKFKEDLLDIIAWAAFTYWHKENGLSA